MNTIIVTVIGPGDDPIEDQFEFNPHRLTAPEAIKIRPEIDRAIRMLRIAGDFCDSLIDLSMRDLAKTHKQEAEV